MRSVSVVAAIFGGAYFETIYTTKYHIPVYGWDICATQFSTNIVFN